MISMLPFLQQSLNSKNKLGGERKEDRFQQLRQEIDVNSVRTSVLSLLFDCFLFGYWSLVLMCFPSCPLNPLCSPNWPLTLHPPASVSGVLQLQESKHASSCPIKNVLPLFLRIHRFKKAVIWEMYARLWYHVCISLFIFKSAYICCSFMFDFYYIKNFYVNLLVLHNTDFFTLTRKV